MNRSEITASWKAADEAMTVSLNKFHTVLADYRAIKIGDAEFLTARAGHKVIEAAYDIAFAAMAGLPEEEEPEAADANQMNLF
jgi:ABC-type Zn uptake system ZnuABC Zn-binding protein ZnuA